MMVCIQRVQKKTSSMSLTISSSSTSTSSSSSSVIAQRQSSLVQPLCVSPQRGLHDVSTVKGQLVVLECRLRGTPPLQVTWYREDEEVLDSDDFRILQKSGCLYGKELSTLVISEAFPEDSGLFKCVALNSFGTASSSALLDVYNDLEEQLEVEAACLQEAVSPRQQMEAEYQQDTSSFGEGDDDDDFPSELPDSMTLPPPEWPDSPEEDSMPVAE
ncbi:Palladin [Liparis tanakae]|uniref:Palladin n=1 Tax=Liparis tanakae TaxID=230148 RepID=A0A4Z2GFM2_9TELE|nr:Palladin [Liparis tanakae]